LCGGRPPGIYGFLGPFLGSAMARKAFLSNGKGFGPGMVFCAAEDSTSLLGADDIVGCMVELDGDVECVCASCVSVEPEYLLEMLLTDVTLRTSGVCCALPLDTAIMTDRIVWAWSL